MNPKKIKLIIGDFFILLAFAISPGIRGYSNWHWAENAMIAIICGAILYQRHKKFSQPEMK